MLDSAETRMDEVLKVVPYDAAWLRAFRTERDRIASALGSLALRIDHNGSTAVSGLAAKPIIDIQISVKRLHPIPCLRSGACSARLHPCASP